MRNMKNELKSICFFSGFFLVISVNVFAQAPAWSWVRGANGTGNESGSAVAGDAAGNAYVVGSFVSSTIDFGTGVINNTGSSDGFLVKYNAAGTVQWVRTNSGSGADDFWTVA